MFYNVEKKNRGYLMDDIYFSRKKNGEDFTNPPQRSTVPEDTHGEGEFHLNFAPVERPRADSFGGSRPVYSNDPTAFNSGYQSTTPRSPQYVGSQPPTADEQRRIPRQVRESMNRNSYEHRPEGQESGFYPRQQNQAQGDYDGYSSYSPYEEPSEDLYTPESFKADYEDEETEVSEQSRRTPKNIRSNSRGKRMKNKKGRGLKVFLCILLVILICIGGVGAYGFSLLSNLNYNAEGLKKNEYISSSELASSSKVKNILLIGCDDAKGATFSRSDTMMLVSIDTKTKAIKLTSFLRDSYVYIPQKGRKAKLNAASTAGGAQYTIDTIEYNFHIDIDHYVLVDFKMFEELVNALGGVDVKVTKKEADFLNAHCSFGKNGSTPAKEGNNHFPGWKALTYCRIRHLRGETDIDRTARQRKVISAIIKKAKSSEVFNLIKRMDKILPLVETDIEKTELVKLGVGAITSYLRYDIKQMQVPTEGLACGKRIYGQDVLALDIEKNQKALKEFVYNS